MNLPADPAELMVTDRSGLETVCRSLRAAGRFAFDTEFIRERTYEPRVCLVQAATADMVALIDPIAIGDIGPFWDLVNDPAVETVVHAGRQDLEIGHLLSGKPPANLFDVQIAAGLVGLPYPLAYGKLVDQILHIRLTQGETYSEWSQRPLTPDQLHYAVEDVVHLLPLRDRLGKRLEELGRMGWLREEVRRLETVELYTRDLEEPWLKVRGRGGLGRRGLAILRELAVWREAAARERNVPSRSFLRDDGLVELARRRPGSLRDFRNLRSFPKHEADRLAEDVIEAVRRGQAVPEDQCPTLPEERVDWPAGRVLADLAAAVGQSLCLAHGVSHELFATRADYLELADEFGGPPAKSAGSRPPPRLLTGWRREFAGATFTEVLGGKANVAVAGGPNRPHLEFGHVEEGKRGPDHA